MQTFLYKIYLLEGNTRFDFVIKSHSLRSQKDLGFFTSLAQYTNSATFISNCIGLIKKFIDDEDSYR